MSAAPPDPLFLGCYLLTSLAPGCAGRTYIGFTVNPPRRLRQHNGEIKGGAHRTRLRQPWEMVLVVHGFPNKLVALQFEWAWTNPHQSRHFRARLAGGWTRRRPGFLLRDKVLVALEMLSLPCWARLALRLTVVAPHHWPLVQDQFTRLSTPVPAHMPVAVLPLDRMPYTFARGRGTAARAHDDADGMSDGESNGEDGDAEDEDEDDPDVVASILRSPVAAAIAPGRAGSSSQGVLGSCCAVCKMPLSAADALDYALTCPGAPCEMVSHLTCLATAFLETDPTTSTALLPCTGTCPRCGKTLTWGDLVKQLQLRRKRRLLELRGTVVAGSGVADADRRRLRFGDDDDDEQ